MTTLLAGVLALIVSSSTLARMAAVPPSFSQQVVPLAQLDRRQMAAINNATLLAEALRREAEKIVWRNLGRESL